MISGQKTEEKQKNKKNSKKVLTKVETRGKLYLVDAEKSQSETSGNA